MEHAASHVIYLDRKFTRDRFEQRATEQTHHPPPSQGQQDEPDTLRANVKTALGVFESVYVCSTALSALNRIREIDAGNAACIPTFVFTDISLESSRWSHAPGASLADAASSPPVSPLTVTKSAPRQPKILSTVPKLYGLSFLRHLRESISDGTFSRLLIPIAISHAPSINGPSGRRHSQTLVVPTMVDALDAGASDFISSPLHPDRLEGLATLSCRAHLEAFRARRTSSEIRSDRKRSWVGIEVEKPYAYLRESMVSNLMSSICKPETAIIATPSIVYAIDPNREKLIAKLIGTWGFGAHDLSEDELVHAAYLMLQHALAMPELEHWRMPPDELKRFLMGCRAAYNNFVLYHNFRHVVDVLQAAFFFLLRIGTLPPYPPGSARSPSVSRVAPVAALLKPFDAFVLLVAAIGHDVGHPGVNNAFLVALKAPLAQLYNDNSVLEAFHCAAYSQILRRYWTAAFEDTKIRGLLIKSILATDMQVHFKYMADLGNLQEKLYHNKGTDGWSDKVLEDYKILVCGLLIKCADISNVARPFSIAARWSDILQLEFARQGEMEEDVGIPTTLFGGPPELGNLIKLANSQIGFMNIFAYPLFEAVADILPGMHFAVDEIKANQDIWKRKIEAEKAHEGLESPAERLAEGYQHSPRSGSPTRGPLSSPQASHPEGLPASGSAPHLPVPPPLNTSMGTLDLASSNHKAADESADTLNQPSPSLQHSGGTGAGRRPSSAQPLYDIGNLASKLTSQDAATPAPGANASNSKRNSISKTAFKDEPFGPQSAGATQTPLQDSSKASIEGRAMPSPVRITPTSKDPSRSGAQVSPVASNFSRPTSTRHGQRPSGASSASVAVPSRVTSMRTSNTPQGAPDQGEYEHSANAAPFGSNARTSTSSSQALSGADGRYSGDKSRLGSKSSAPTATGGGGGHASQGGLATTLSGGDVYEDPSFNGRTLPTTHESLLRKRRSRFRLDFWRKGQSSGESAL